METFHFKAGETAKKIAMGEMYIVHRHDAKEPTKPATIEQAREIMQYDFFGPAQIERALNTRISPNSIPEIQFTTDQLERARTNGQYLILRINKTDKGKPITIEELNRPILNVPRNSIWNHYEQIQIIDGGSKRFYRYQQFFHTETPRPKWALVTKQAIPNTKGKSFLSQTAKIVPYIIKNVLQNDIYTNSLHMNAIQEFQKIQPELQELLHTWQAEGKLHQISELAKKLVTLKFTQLTRPRAVEMIYDMVVNYQVDGSDFLPDSLTYTSSLTSSDAFIAVGNFTNNGVLIAESRGDHKNIGTCLSMTC